MIAYINDLPINDLLNPNGLYLDEPLEGLDSADIRLSADVYSGQDGGYTGDALRGLRLVSLPGHVWATNTSDFLSRRRLLLDAIEANDITLKLWLDDDHHYILFGKLQSPPNMPFTRTLNKSPYRLHIVCADHLIYDDISGNLLSATVGKSVGGGITWPIVWPINWAAGTGATTVNNTGTATIYPVATITGSITNPVFTNETTNQFISLESFSAPVGSVVVIDFRQHTVTLNGGNILSKVSDDSSWWGLRPGNNTLRLTTGDSADTASAVVEWRNGFLGI